MRNEESVTLDGLRFRVAKIAPRRAMRCWNELVQCAVPGLPALAPVIRKVSQGETKLADMEVLDLVLDATPALALALPKLDVAKQDYFIDELLSATMFIGDGQAVPVLDVFDNVFLGKIATAYKLLGVALKVNFGSFRGALVSTGAGRLTPMPSPSETSGTSAGQSSG
jgi:hypothetical protein